MGGVPLFVGHDPKMLDGGTNPFGYWPRATGALTPSIRYAALVPDADASVQIAIQHGSHSRRSPAARTTLPGTRGRQAFTIQLFGDCLQPVAIGAHRENPTHDGCLIFVDAAIDM